MALVAGDWHRCPSSIRQQIWVTSGDPFKLIFGALFDSWFLFNRTLCDFSCLRSLKNGPLRFQPRLPGLETSFVLCFVQTNISRMQGLDAILDHVIGRAPVRVTSNLTRPSAQPCPSALSKVSSWRWLLPLSWPVCWLYCHASLVLQQRHVRILQCLIYLSGEQHFLILTTNLGQCSSYNIT